MKVLAKLTYPENGYDSDIENVKKLDPNVYYETKNISVGRSYTNFSIMDMTDNFNSVNFEFFDEELNPIDIFKIKEFRNYCYSQ